ncbi:hypothetical protein BJ741DRAFT_602034 [Chytriomyces cf. hyalinus JEL632]|nr:hypothetical protein BJ741DRAFT_602034 [Chytriomyces cf. hyalinus JEL632]
MSTSLGAPMVVTIFLSAMAFENAAKGLVLSLNKFHQSSTTIPAIMIITNVLALFFGPIYIWTALATTRCQESWFLAKVVMHLFFTSFAAFLLYKTWIISQRRTAVAAGATALLLHRTTWTILDWVSSKAVATPSSCFYMQDKTSIVGIATAGILVDLFCTGCTIWSAIRDVDPHAAAEMPTSKLKQIYKVLIADNVFRTFLILACNSFTLTYCALSTLEVTAGNPRLVLLIPALTNFVYTQALNAEFHWINVRQDILKADNEFNEQKVILQPMHSV